MNLLFRISRALPLIGLLALVSTQKSSADGYVPELEPRQGEQRLNRFQYHSIHNAFIRGTSLEEQVDNWGAYQLELDIWYDNGSYDVQHNSCDIIGEAPLSEYLADLGKSNALRQGFIFLQLQLHVEGTGACSLGMSPFPATWTGDLVFLLQHFLGHDVFYTFKEFRDRDNYRWPSLQELRRRGKHVAVFKGSTYNDFYFNRQALNDCDTEWDSSPSDRNNTRAQVNTASNTHCWDLGDRWVSRHYPSVPLAFEESFSGWSDIVDQGFTFPATNNDDDVDRIGDARLHPPFPTYVRKTSPHSEEVGTWGRPYAGVDGLLQAVFRIKAHEIIKGASNVPVILQGNANYSSLGSLQNLPPYMTLAAQGGPVIIGP